MGAGFEAADGVNGSDPLDATPVPVLLERSVARFPDRPAMAFQGRRWTYAALGRLVGHAAAGLQALGVAKGDRVGLCLPNTPYFIVFYYAALKVGAVVVNTNPLHVARELRAQILDAGVTTMIVLDVTVIHDKVAGIAAAAGLKRIVVCPLTGVLPAGKALAYRVLKRRGIARPRWSDGAGACRVVRYRAVMANDGRPAPVAIDPERDLAVLQYTGGTTGLPKGAMLTHANVAVNAVQVIRHMPTLRPGQERMMAVLPFFHVFAMTTVMNCGIALGAEIIMHTRFERDAVMRSIARDRPTVFNGVPTIYNAIASAAETGRVDISSLRICISGGAPLPAEIRERFERLTGHPLVEGYGLTEASPVVACNRPGDARPGSVGLPLERTAVEIRGLDDPAIVLPAGERGEVCVRGPQVMQGYLGRPDDTRDAFVDGALRTGDAGYLDANGTLYITDRIKDLILCGGYNVYPRTIEDALYEHPAVAEAIVIGIPDPYRGQTPLAFVTLRPGHPAQPDELREFLRGHLSPIELPGRVEIRDALPKTMIGKLSRKELVAEFVPGTAGAASGAAPPGTRRSGAP